MSRKYDVFGMCNALFDIQAEVSDDLLAALGYEKGGMFLIDEESQRAVVSRVYNSIVHTEAGGSGANTMMGVALLGGTACYTSRVGADEHGRLYLESLESKGVRTFLATGQGDTGISLILITPDTQRTMLTFLGQSQLLNASDVPIEALQQSQYLYVTAYLWDTDNQKEAVLRAMSEANRTGVRVALSLSDPFCVNRHKAEIWDLVRKHVDVLFGNYQEAQALTDTETPEAALLALADHCDVAVVTMDSDGSLLRAGGVTHRVPAYRIRAVDTTGAGDMYAAGLMYGLARGLTLETTGRIASYYAAAVVAKLGPRLEALPVPPSEVPPPEI